MHSDYLRGKMIFSAEPKMLGWLKREHIKDIESKFNVEVRVDKKGGVIEVIPKEGATLDQVLKVREVVRAITYGFKLEDALLLENDDYRLEVIDLKEFFDKESHLVRVKGRIIGEGGKAKLTLQELTDTRIFVGDRYVAIIGPTENVLMAKEAIQMLIRGRQHGTVYKYLSRWLREKRRVEFGLG